MIPAMKYFRAFFILVLLSTTGWAQDLAILHAKIYTSPISAPISDGAVLIRNGKITAVGRHVPIPSNIPHLECDGCVVLSGFWNSHVHFMEPKWIDAAHLPAPQLKDQLQQMLTHSGFTTVVDCGSDPQNTAALRERIETGEAPGPHIYTAGYPLYPFHALPYYLSSLPEEVRQRLPQPETPAQAITAVDQNLASGTDLIKLFTGSIVAPDRTTPMPVAIATAAVAEGHRHQQPVFTHPTDLQGVRIALESGVDVLAHAPEHTNGIDNAFIQTLVTHHMAMIPTLKLFSRDSNIAAIRSVVFQFHSLGGVLIFGTDTGFLPDYDMSEEYRQLSLAGLSWREILAMLTTAPAQLFGVADHKGRVAPGMDGDLTILAADPGSGDPVVFTHVRYTIRGGQVIFHAE